MEYIEVNNGEKRRWRIDGSPFHDWVEWTNGKWHTMEEETARLQLVFPRKRKLSNT